MNNDERVQVVRPLTRCQQLLSNVDGAMMSTGVGRCKHRLASPGFHLQIPVGIDHLLFSFPERGNWGIVTFRLRPGQALIRLLDRDEQYVIALPPTVPVLLEDVIHPIGAVTRQSITLRSLVRPILLCDETPVKKP
jgi:hypothetical protein